APAKSIILTGPNLMMALSTKKLRKMLIERNNERGNCFPSLWYRWPVCFAVSFDLVGSLFFAPTPAFPAHWKTPHQPPQEHKSFSPIDWTPNCKPIGCRSQLRHQRDILSKQSFLWRGIDRS